MQRLGFYLLLFSYNFLPPPAPSILLTSKLSACNPRLFLLRHPVHEHDPCSWCDGMVGAITKETQNNNKPWYDDDDGGEQLLKMKQKLCCWFHCKRKFVIIKMCTILAPKCPLHIFLHYIVVYIYFLVVVAVVDTSFPYSHLFASHEKHDKNFHFSELKCIKNLMFTGHDKDSIIPIFVLILDFSFILWKKIRLLTFLPNAISFHKFVSSFESIHFIYGALTFKHHFSGTTLFKSQV